MDAPPPSHPPRPMTLGELVTGVFTLYRRNFLLLVTVAAIFVVPYQLLAAALQSPPASLSGIQGGHASSFQVHQFLQYLGHAALLGSLIVAVCGLVVLPLGTAALTRVIADRYQERATSVGAGFRVALGRWLPLLGVGVLVLVFVAGASVVLSVVTLLLILALKTVGGLLAGLIWLAAAVIAVIAWIRIAVVLPVVVLEPVDPWLALRRSWALSRGHAWLVFGFVVVLGLVVLVATFILGLVVGGLALLAGGTGSPGYRVILELLSIVVATLTTPISALGLVLLYFNLRGRQEGASAVALPGPPTLQPWPPAPTV